VLDYGSSEPKLRWSLESTGSLQPDCQGPRALQREFLLCPVCRGLSSSAPEPHFLTEAHPGRRQTPLRTRWIPESTGLHATGLSRFTACGLPQAQGEAYHGCARRCQAAPGRRREAPASALGRRRGSAAVRWSA